MISSSVAAVVPSLALAAGWGTHGRILTLRLRTARRDPLTGLPTRAAWTAEAQRILQRRPQDAAILLIDLDKFKAVNDGYGHAAGDAVLIAAAERLSAHFQGRGIVGRLGGDEFAAVVYPGTGSPFDELSSEFALQYDLSVLTHELMREPVALPDGEEAQLQASIGAAMYTEVIAPSLARSLHVADQMMYQCKRLGSRWFVAAAGQDPQIERQQTGRQRHHGPQAVAG